MNLLRKYWCCLFVVLFISITIFYVGIQEQGIYLQIHDFLDSHPAWYKMMKDNGLFWEIEGMVPFLGGIDRNYLYSDFKVCNWIYMVFPVYWGIVIIWYLKIIVAIIGFYLLAQTIGYGDRNIACFCGFLYGLVPTFPPVDLAFSSLPLLAYLLFKIKKSFDKRFLIYLLFYPVLSEFVLFGIFICGYIFVYILWDYIKKRKLNYHFCLALSLIAIGYIITEWRLFYIILCSNEPTIRTIWMTPEIPIVKVVEHIFRAFVRGDYHARALHTIVVLPVCMWVLVSKRNCKHRFSNVIKYVIGMIFINCMVLGVDETVVFKEFVGIIAPLLKGIVFSRTIWLNPFLWYFAFMLSLVFIKDNLKKYSILILAFLVLCIGDSRYNNIYLNFTSPILKKINGEINNELTFKEFYSEELFDDIKRDINYDSEWSVAFGMHPSVLEYNGIYTLDGYLSYYPLSYKKQFRELIAPQLRIDQKNETYFDNSGIRAYIYSKEIGFGTKKVMEKESARMNIDTDKFRNMNGKYVFSRVKIENIEDLEMEIVNVYTSKDSPYVIYLYRLKN